MITKSARCGLGLIPTSGDDLRPSEAAIRRGAADLGTRNTLSASFSAAAELADVWDRSPVDLCDDLTHKVSVSQRPLGCNRDERDCRPFSASVTNPVASMNGRRPLPPIAAVDRATRSPFDRSRIALRLSHLTGTLQP